MLLEGEILISSKMVTENIMLQWLHKCGAAHGEEGV